MRLPSRLTGLTLLLAGLAALAAAAGAAGKDDPRLKLPEPSFRPGAGVAWEIEVLPPPGWHINHLVPLVVSFDHEALKGLPVSLNRERFEFELEDYRDSYVASLPLQISLKAADGEYSLPARVDCSICTQDNSACTFAEAPASVALRIRASAPKSEKNQALAKGILRSSAALLQSE